MPFHVDYPIKFRFLTIPCMSIALQTDELPSHWLKYLFYSFGRSNFVRPAKDQPLYVMIWIFTTNGIGIHFQWESLSESETHLANNKNSHELKYPVWMSKITGYLLNTVKLSPSGQQSTTFNLLNVFVSFRKIFYLRSVKNHTNWKPFINDLDFIWLLKMSFQREIRTR